MLEQVHVGTVSIGCYEHIVGADVMARLRTLAKPLRGARVLHINATPYGGGVAEILFSEIPLLRDLGIAADWRIIAGDADFFHVTKHIHNGLQGADRDLSASERQIYLAGSAHNAKSLEGEYDLIIVHDPQPLVLLQMHGKGKAKWIWRCHIDTAQPNARIWDFLRPYLAGYDAAVYTLREFVPPQMPIPRVEIIPPAIDPASPKNLEMDTRLARRLLQWIGVDLDRPLIAQISRFDPWKDPFGVIEVYRRVKHEIPQVQLALVGSMALDDPEAWDIYRKIHVASLDDPDLHIFTNLTGVSSVEVNAFQRLANVVIQKSLREGFGLVVSETLWKGTPVVAARAGGIPLQLQDGVGGFLVESVEQCAERTVWILKHPDEARTLGEKGRQRVQQHFLLPRLIADELKLIAALLEAS